MRRRRRRSVLRRPLVAFYICIYVPGRRVCESPEQRPTGSRRARRFVALLPFCRRRASRDPVNGPSVREFDVYRYFCFNFSFSGEGCYSQRAQLLILRAKGKGGSPKDGASWCLLDLPRFEWDKYLGALESITSTARLGPVSHAIASFSSTRALTRKPAKVYAQNFMCKDSN